MGRTNEQVVSDFIKTRLSDRKNKGNIDYNTSNTLHCVYGDKSNDLISYNTVIARYDLDSNIVYLSDKSMTPTTSKHRGLVVDVTLDNGLKVMNVPLAMGQRNFPTFEHILDSFEARMDMYSMGTDLALSENRKEFMLNYERYNEFIKVTGLKPKNKEKYDKISSNLEDTEYIKTLKAKRREFLANKDKMYVDTLNDTELFNS